MKDTWKRIKVLDSTARGAEKSRHAYWKPQPWKNKKEKKAKHHVAGPSPGQFLNQTIIIDKYSSFENGGGISKSIPWPFPLSVC